MPTRSDSGEEDVVEVSAAAAAALQGNRKKRKRHHSSSSSDSSSSSSSSSSDSSEDERRRRKKAKSAAEAKKGRSKKSKKSKKHKKRKKDKKDKQEPEGAAFGAVGHRWGRYGIIHETDLWKKRPEFTLWLLEVKDKNIETLSNWEEKKLFSDFAEDFNTASLPHKKFYNLELWEAEERMRLAQAAPLRKEQTEFNDEAERMREIRKIREERKKLLAAQELQLLRQDREKVMDMREQRLLTSKVETLYKLGRNAEAEALAERLKPDA